MAIHDEMLSVGVNVDTKTALSQMGKFQRDMARAMQQLTKTVEGVGKVSGKVNQSSARSTEEWASDVDELAHSYSKTEKVIKALQNRMEDASDDQKEALQEQIDLLEKMNKKIAQTTFVPALAKDSAKRAAKEFGGAMRDTWGSFTSKDLKGSLEHAAKGFGAALKGSLKISAATMGATGGAMKRFGGGLLKRGEARGGMAGAGMAGAGKALKAVGGLVSKMGPLLNMFTKLGPLLGAMSSAVMAIVKLFIDAEAQAKAFNKEILTSASTTEFLSEAGGNADVAFQELETTMRGIRDAAYSLENLKWGITADEHKAVLNVLTQEGVSLRRISSEAKVAKEGVQTFAAELTHVSVAYSRAFGVSLQEVNQFQAEMMTEMAQSAKEVQLSFALMTRAATESGIASNKFFGIIRGVSQDLSLYNVRMEQAANTLKLLGKVMNPREAQKFMSFATQGLKQMSQDDRLKVALLAGDKGKQIVAKDLENKRKNLQKDIGQAIGMEADEVAKRLSDPKAAKELWKQVDAQAKEQAGTLRGSALELKIDETAAKKGAYGQAFAMQNLGMGASLEMMQTAMSRFSGGKTLMEGAGDIGLTKMAENLGVGADQLRAMMKLEAAVEGQKETLLSQAKTQEEKDKINAMGTQDILDTMSKEEQTALKDANKSQLDMAKQQSHLTQSVVDKLGVLVDFVMNQLYNVFLDIWGVVSKIADPFGSEETNVKREAFLSKDKGVQEALKKATGAGGLDVYKFRGEMVTKEIGPAVSDALRHYSEAMEKGGTKEQEYVRNAMTQVTGALEQSIKQVSSEGYDPKATAERLGKVLADAKIDEKRQAKIKETVAGGADIGEALRENLKTSEMMGVYRKMAWQADPSTLIKQAENIKKGTAHVTEMRASGSKLDAANQERLAKEMGIDPKQLKEMFKLEGKAGDAVRGGTFHETDEGQKAIASTAVSAEDTAQATAHLDAEATKNGTLYVMFSNAYHRKFEKAIHDETLEALRQGLFEYYMYSGIEDRGAVASFMKQERMNPVDLAKMAGEQAARGETMEAPVMGANMADAPMSLMSVPGNAAGGYVYGVDGGLAQVRAAAGEGLASVGPGERIIPAGGGGGGSPINVNVNGVGGADLAKIIHAKVVDGIAEYKRRERFN